jgi:hypothetical protein
MAKESRLSQVAGSSPTGQRFFALSQCLRVQREMDATLRWLGLDIAARCQWECDDPGRRLTGTSTPV